MNEELKMSEELQMVVHLIIGEMDKRFDALEERMDRLEERMDRLEERMDRLEERMDRLEERMDRLEERMDRLEERMDHTEKDMKLYVNGLVDEMGRMEVRINARFEKIDARFDRMDARLDSMQHEINACKLACDPITLLVQKVDQHEFRIDRLEKKSGIGKMLPVGN